MKDTGDVIGVDAFGEPIHATLQGLPDGGKAVTQAVISANGNVKLTCNGILPPEYAAPDRAVMFSGDDTFGACSTLLGHTFDWQNVVTKSGRVSLTCHLNINQEE